MRAARVCGPNWPSLAPGSKPNSRRRFCSAKTSGPTLCSLSTGMLHSVGFHTNVTGAQKPAHALISTGRGETHEADQISGHVAAGCLADSAAAAQGSQGYERREEGRDYGGAQEGRIAGPEFGQRKRTAGAPWYRDRVFGED